jgi:translation initiation factor IF-3
LHRPQKPKTATSSPNTREAHIAQQQATQQRAQDSIRVNRRIRVPEVRVINADGEQLGIMTIGEALRMAEEAVLDLVEVSPKAMPPVCRIMDYGKYKYLQKKKAAEANRNATKSLLKEVKLRPKTDDHDVNFKINHIREFLKEGHKAKVTIMFRGREIVHQEIGKNHLDLIAKTVVEEGVGIVESTARLEGRNMTMILAPKG